jgi:hypothetical protein
MAMHSLINLLVLNTDNKAKRQAFMINDKISTTAKADVHNGTHVKQAS